MSQLPNRNGDALILEMLNRRHQYTYSMADYTILSIGPANRLGRNTAVVISFNAGPRAGDTVTFYYFRLDTQILIGARNLQITNGTITSTHDLIAPINSALGLFLTTADLIDTPINVSSYPAVVTITAAPQSRVLFGSGTVTLVSPDNGVGTAPFLYGYHALTNSKEESFHLFGFDEDAGITGEVSGFNGALDNHDLAYDQATSSFASNDSVAFIGSNKYIDVNNRTSHVIGFNITPTGVSKVAGEFDLSVGTIGSYPLTAIRDDGICYVAEVARGSLTGEYTLVAVQIVDNAVVQIGNRFNGELLVDVGMGYQNYGFKSVGIIDGHFIVTFTDENGLPTNINCAAFSFDGTDFSLVRTWTPSAAAGNTLRIVNGRLVGFPSYTSCVVYGYSASSGASELFAYDFQSLVPNGGLTTVTVLGYDLGADNVWVALYDDSYIASAIAVFEIDFIGQTMNEIARISNLDGALASPDLIHNNLAFGPNAEWTNYIIRRLVGNTLEVVDTSFNPPPGTRFVLPLPATP